MLSLGRVRINGAVCKISSRSVGPDDKVSLGERTTPAKVAPGLEIVYEDKHLLVIQKPAGLLTVATPHERDHTVFVYLQRYLKRRDPRNGLFVVHRLDRFVSGLLVFAKSVRVKERLQELFGKHDVDRRYWAIVEGRVGKERGTIRSRLVEGESKRMRSARGETGGKEAVTHFRVLRRFPTVTVLEITLETGRKNQIRVHLSEAGHPVVGDRAYGSEQNPLGRMGLHAFRLGFLHPEEGIPMMFESEPPVEFRGYLALENAPSSSVRDGAATNRSAIGKPGVTS